MIVSCDTLLSLSLLTLQKAFTRIYTFRFLLSVFLSVEMFTFCFFFQAEDGIRDIGVTGVQTCALPICDGTGRDGGGSARHGDRRRTRHRRLAGCRAGPDQALQPTLNGLPGAPEGQGRAARSGERRVGKECRSRWWPHHLKKEIL